MKEPHYTIEIAGADNLTIAKVLIKDGKAIVIGDPKAAKEALLSGLSLFPK